MTEPNEAQETPKARALRVMQEQVRDVQRKAHIPCSATVKPCGKPVIGRVGDASEQGFVGMYVCEDHIAYGIRDVHKSGHEAILVRWYIGGESTGDVERRRAASSELEKYRLFVQGLLTNAKARQDPLADAPMKADEVRDERDVNDLLLSGEFAASQRLVNQIEAFRNSLEKR